MHFSYKFKYLGSALTHYKKYDIESRRYIGITKQEISARNIEKGAEHLCKINPSISQRIMESFLTDGNEATEIQL